MRAQKRNLRRSKAFQNIGHFVITRHINHIKSNTLTGPHEKTTCTSSHLLGQDEDMNYNLVEVERINSESFLNKCLWVEFAGFNLSEITQNT